MSAVDPTPALRRMAEADVEAIMAIEEEVYASNWTAGIFRDCLRVGYECWVLKVDERVIGYGIMSIGAGEAHILNIAVRARFQGRGLGRRMLEHLLGLARGAGAETALLEVRPSNTVALSLYAASGFNEIGRRRGYYSDSDGREDALVLSRPLSAAEAPSM